MEGTLIRLKVHLICRRGYEDVRGGGLCRDHGTLVKRNKNQLSDYMTTEPARLAGIPVL